MHKRKTCVVTGTRAEYGLLRSVMRAIKKEKRLRLQIVAAGMHLSGQFGRTEREIKADRFRIDARVAMTSQRDSSAAMASSIGKGVQGMVMVFNKLKPDVVVVLGDRVEALAAAIAAAYMNIPLAHIHGGDSAEAGLDESARHAITKLAHIHFPATTKSSQRIVKMGERKDHVFVVGAPGLDEILGGTATSRAALVKKFNLKNGRPLALMIQHPVTTDAVDAQRQIRETLEALTSLKLDTIIVHPNADAGGRGMTGVIRNYTRKHPFLRSYVSLERKDFLGLMDMADVMVGNSSSGIIESASFGAAAVNIGPRQAGRERASNVIDVGYDRRRIVLAIRKALTSTKFKTQVRRKENPYGNGTAGTRIAKILSRIALTPALLQKKLTY